MGLHLNSTNGQRLLVPGEMAIKHTCFRVSFLSNVSQILPEVKIISNSKRTEDHTSVNCNRKRVKLSFYFV